MKYALALLSALRYSGEDDSESQAPGYLGSSGSAACWGVDARDGRWPGDPTAKTLEEAGVVARVMTGTAWRRESSRSFECSTGGWEAGLAGDTDRDGPEAKTQCR